MNHNTIVNMLMNILLLAVQALGIPPPDELIHTRSGACFQLYDPVVCGSDYDKFSNMCIATKQNGYEKEECTPLDDFSCPDLVARWECPCRENDSTCSSPQWFLNKCEAKVFGGYDDPETECQFPCWLPLIDDAFDDPMRCGPSNKLYENACDAKEDVYDPKTDCFSAWCKDSGSFKFEIKGGKSKKCKWLSKKKKRQQKYCNEKAPNKGDESKLTKIKYSCKRACAEYNEKCALEQKTWY